MKTEKKFDVRITAAILSCGNRSHEAARILRDHGVFEFEDLKKISWGDICSCHNFGETSVLRLVNSFGFSFKNIHDLRRGTVAGESLYDFVLRNKNKKIAKTMSIEEKRAIVYMQGFEVLHHKGSPLHVDGFSIHAVRGSEIAFKQTEEEALDLVIDSIRKTELIKRGEL